MSVRERLSRILGFGSVPAPDPRQLTAVWPSWTADGGLMTVSEALSLSAVWACVSLISRSLASCEWQVYERSNGQLTVRDEDPLAYLLNVRPNPEMSAMSLKEALISSALVWGDGFLEIVKDGAGRVAELWPIDSERVQLIRVGVNAPLKYRVTAYQGGTIDLSASDVFHLRGPSLNGFVGENIVNRGAKTLVLSQAAEAFSTSYYRNSTVIGGVIEAEKALDPKAYERIRDSWKARNAGPGKAFGVAVLESGMKWKPLTADAGTSQMLEAQKWQLEQTARWFGVPVHLLGSLAGSQGYGSNLETLGSEFKTLCLGPWARRIENESDKLTPMRGPGARRQIRIDLSPLSRPDLKTRMEAYAIARRIGLYSVNDCLKKEGENTIGEEGDLRLVEAAMVPLDAVEDKAEAELEKLTAPPPTPALPSAEPTDETDTEDPKESPENVARAAAGIFYGQALERHQGRVAKGMDAAKSMAKLQTECDAALSFLHRAGLQGPNGALSKCADAVLVGQPPTDAAALLAGGLERA